VSVITDHGTAKEKYWKAMARRREEKTREGYWIHRQNKRRFIYIQRPVNYKWPSESKSKQKRKPDAKEHRRTQDSGNDERGGDERKQRKERGTHEGAQV
jgi:hypothetical protein